MNEFSEIKNSNTKIRINKYTHIGNNVVLGSRCKNVEIGFGCFIGNDIYIDVDNLIIGDYTTIHHGSVIHGINTIIGHNCWIGHYSIIDSLGGNTILGNNVGVGAHSQLWSHMKFGDMLNGCRWNSSSELILEDDVWLVGHSIVGPIHAEAKSMLLTGSVATKNMNFNSIYAGNPARNVTDKFGFQFDEIDIDEKQIRFEELRNEFCTEFRAEPDLFITTNQFDENSLITQFNLAKRTYRPIRSDLEYKFIKYMLYDKAKWIPDFIPNSI